MRRLPRQRLPGAAADVRGESTPRHSFGAHLPEDGYDIRTACLCVTRRQVQELLGHKNVKTTMRYTHVLNKGGKGVRSPVDNL